MRTLVVGEFPVAASSPVIASHMASAADSDLLWQHLAAGIAGAADALEFACLRRG